MKQLLVANDVSHLIVESKQKFQYVRIWVLSYALKRTTWIMTDLLYSGHFIEFHTYNMIISSPNQSQWTLLICDCEKWYVTWEFPIWFTFYSNLNSE